MKEKSISQKGEQDSNAADDKSKPIKNKNPLIFLLLLFMIIAGSIGGIIYWKINQSRVYIEKAEINAQIISLFPNAPGVLDNMFVREGDKVQENMIVARVGGMPIRAKTNGMIISVLNTPGEIISAQTPVVKMIDSSEFKVIGRLGEDKGLRYIKPGQLVIFTVDAFGSKEYQGIVDSISPTSRESDIVFSISDKRQEKEFEVKVKFDIDAYPELKNGMSAKMWVYK